MIRCCKRNISFSFFKSINLKFSNKNNPPQTLENNTTNSIKNNLSINCDIKLTAQSKFNNNEQIQKIKKKYYDCLMNKNIYQIVDYLVRSKKIQKNKLRKLSKLEMIQELCSMPLQFILQKLHEEQQLKGNHQKIVQQIEAKKQNAFQEQNKIKQQRKAKFCANNSSQMKKHPQKSQNRQQPSNLQQIDIANKKKFTLKDYMALKIPKQLMNVQMSQKMSNKLVGQRSLNSFFSKYKKSSYVYSNKLKQQNQQLENQQSLIQQSQQPKQPINKQKEQEFEEQFNFLKYEEQFMKFNSSKLFKKPLINKLFKTQEQFLIPEDNIKKIYQYQKRFILQQLMSQKNAKTIKFVREYIKQLKQDRLQNNLILKFPLDLKYLKPKIFLSNPIKSLTTFTGFNYYKNLVQDDYLFQFMYSIYYNKNLPIEYTVLKICQKYVQSPKIFEQNLRSISDHFFMYFLRQSNKYFQRILKSSNNTDLKQSVQTEIQEQTQQTSQDYNTQYTTEEEQQFGSNSLTKQSSNNQQKSSASQLSNDFIKKKPVDFNMTKLAYSIMNASLQRIIKKLKQGQKEQQISGQQNQKNFGREQKGNKNSSPQKQNAKKQQMIKLCFDIYKVLQKQLINLQINNLNDLDNYFEILNSYNQFRKKLSKQIFIIQAFIKKMDKNFQQKAQLGLIPIITHKQLTKQNFILNLQGRKINFDINDTIISILKQDNIQITIQNKRSKIFKTIERFMNIYIENGMIDMIEQQLVYNCVRFLEKEVYLNRKINEVFNQKIYSDIQQVQQETQQKQQFKQNVNQQSDSQSLYEFQSPYMYNLKELPKKNVVQFKQQLQDLFKQQSFTNLSNSSTTKKQANSQDNYDHNANYDQGMENPNILLKKQKKYKQKYFQGKIEELLNKQILVSLLQIIKHKYKRNQVIIEQIIPFNLIQQWYIEPRSIRLQFLRQQIVGQIRRRSQQY